MVATVPEAETIHILRVIAEDPAAVRALRAVDACTFGPLPFFVAWQGVEAEVTFAFSGGALAGLVSVRIGDRYSNESDWVGAPLDDLGRLADLIELSLSSAAERL